MQPGDAPNERERAVEDLEQAYRALSAAQRRLRGRDAMLDEGLSVPQYMLLRPLLATEAMSSGELSREAGLTPATATHMLDQLVRAGIVVRERADHDRRVVMTSLTDDGRRHLQKRHDSIMVAWKSMIDDLSDDALRNAAEVLRLMAGYLDAL